MPAPYRPAANMAFLAGTIVLVGVLPFLVHSRGLAAGENSPRAVLETHGLTKHGRYWCVAEELELRELVALLPPLERRQLELKLQIEQALAQNEILRQRQVVLEAQLKRTRELAKAAPAGSLQRKQLDAEIKSQQGELDLLKKSALPPEKFAATSVIKNALVEWSNVRTDLALATLAIETKARRMNARYRALGGLNTVSVALTALPLVGEGIGETAEQQLGPARNYSNDLKRAEKAGQTVLQGSLPIFREGKHWRTVAILSEKIPATFSVADQSGPVVLTANLAEAAGVEPKANAPVTKFRAEGGRAVEARAAIIGQLRLGDVLLENVSCLVLPPEAEDVGSHLGRDDLDGLGMRIDAANLQIRVETTK